MSPYHTILTLATGAATVTLCGARDIPQSVSRASHAPNIIVILSDDMGYTDIGCYGGEIKTPAIDRLASQGLRFTQFYNNARCCPSRASLMTGLYPHTAGMGHMNVPENKPGYTGSIRNHSATMAEVLRPAGYATYAVGKWHLAQGVDERQNWPLQRGFEKFYGTISGYGSFYDPATLCRGNTLITPLNDADYKPARFYYTDAITDNAVSFLRQHQDADPRKPFFMYVAYTAAHWPMHALPEDIAKYKGVYDKGYNAIREARFKRAIELGALPPDAKLTPPDNDDWETLPNKAWEIRCMEVYAAMIDRMDQGIARILAQLEASGQLENTIVMFLQDNGACAETTGRTSNAGKTAGKTYPPLGPDELQTKTRPPMQTRDGRPVRTGPRAMPGPDDTFISVGHNWANVSNTPFREYKHWVHEGGISTPLIVRWPAGIHATLNGSFVHTPGHLIDIAATCYDFAGVGYPAENNGVKLPPLPGASLRPLFSGQPLKRPTPLFWEHEGNRAVRDGKWKLVAIDHDGPWELYDIEADRAELQNLVAQKPDIASRLAAAWEAWAVEAKAKPWPWGKDGLTPNKAGQKKMREKQARLSPAQPN